MELEEDVAVRGCVTGGANRDLAQPAIGDADRLAADDKLALASFRVRDAAMERESSVPFRSFPLGEVGSMKTNRRPSPMIGVTGCTRGDPSALTVAR